MASIKIKDKTFILNLGMGVYIALGEKWNLPGVNEVLARFGILQDNPEQLTFEKINLFNEIVVAMVNSSDENQDKVTEGFLSSLSMMEYLEAMQMVVSEISKNVVSKASQGKLPAVKSTAVKKKI